MKPTERLGELDRIFDLLLVLLGIITSALFQLACTVEPLEIGQNLTGSEFVKEAIQAILKDFRILFIPLVLLLVLWLGNRILLRARMLLRKTFSEFCYLFAFQIILIDISALVGLSLYPYNYPQLTLTLLVLTIPQFLVSLGIVYYYEIPFIYREKIRTRKEAWRRIWAPILLRTSIIWYVTFALNYAIFHLCWTATISWRARWS